MPPSRIEELRRRDAEFKRRFGALLSGMSDALEADDFHAVIDGECDLGELLDVWVDVRDEIDYRDGFAHLEDRPELRASLIAWGRETFDGVGARSD